MPRSIPDAEVRKLRRSGDLTDKDGKRFKPTLSVKKKAPVTSEERQARALEAIGLEIKELLQANSRNAVILLEMIKKIKTDVTLETPKPISKWKHTYTDLHGNKKTLISEAV